MNDCSDSGDACCRAMSASITIPVSWSWFCQACRNRFAAASADPYAGSKEDRETWCAVRAMELVAKENSRMITPQHFIPQSSAKIHRSKRDIQGSSELQLKYR